MCPEMCHDSRRTTCRSCHLPRELHLTRFYQHNNVEGFIVDHIMQGEELVCGFCGHGKKVEEHCGKFLSCRAEHVKMVSAHHKCMQYSSGLTQYTFKQFGGFDANEVQNEIERGRKLVCSWCKKAKEGKRRMTGATAGCIVEKCKKSFHFLCAKLHAKTSRRKRKTKKGRELDLYHVFCSKKHEKEYKSSENGKQEYSCSETDEEFDVLKSSQFEKKSLDSYFPSFEEGCSSINEESLLHQGRDNNNDKSGSSALKVDSEEALKKSKLSMDCYIVLSPLECASCRSLNGITQDKAQNSILGKSLEVKQRLTEDDAFKCSEVKMLQRGSLVSSVDTVKMNLKREMRVEADSLSKRSVQWEAHLPVEADSHGKRTARQKTQRKRKSKRIMSQNDPFEFISRRKYRFLSASTTNSLADRIKNRPCKMHASPVSETVHSSDWDDFQFPNVSSQINKSKKKSPPHEERILSSSNSEMPSDVKVATTSSGTELSALDDDVPTSAAQGPPARQVDQMKLQYISLKTGSNTDSSDMEELDLPFIETLYRKTRKTASLRISVSKDAETLTTQRNKDTTNTSVSNSDSVKKQIPSGASFERESFDGDCENSCMKEAGEESEIQLSSECLQDSDEFSRLEENSTQYETVKIRMKKEHIQHLNLYSEHVEVDKDSVKDCVSSYSSEPLESRKGYNNSGNVTEKDLPNFLNLPAHKQNTTFPDDEDTFTQIENKNSASSPVENESSTFHPHNSDSFLWKSVDAEGVHHSQREVSVAGKNHDHEQSEIETDEYFVTVTSQCDPDQPPRELLAANCSNDDDVKARRGGSLLTVGSQSSGVDGMTVSADEERRQPDEGLEHLQTGPASAQDCADCVLVIPTDIRHFEHVVFDVQYKVAEDFGMEENQIHIWTAITPVLLPTKCMLYYFRDIVDTLQNQDWYQLRQLLTNADTLHKKYREEYSLKMSYHKRLISSEQKEQEVAVLVESIVVGMNNATVNSSCLMGVFSTNFGVNYLADLINDRTDKKRILRKTFDQKSAMYQWQETAVSFTSFDGISAKELQGYHMQESTVLCSWFTKNFSQVLKVIVLPEEDVLLSGNSQSSSVGSCFAQLKSRMEEREISSSLAGESDLPVILFIRRVDRDIVHFEYYLQACLKKYSKAFAGKRLTCVFHVDDLSVRKCPKLDLGRTDCVVKMYSVFSPSKKPVTLLIADVQRN